MMYTSSPLMKRSLSYDAVVKVVAAGEATTPDHIRQIHIRAAANESLEPPEVKRIKRSATHAVWIVRTSSGSSNFPLRTSEKSIRGELVHIVNHTR